MIIRHDNLRQAAQGPAVHATEIEIDAPDGVSSLPFTATAVIYPSNATDKSVTWDNEELVGYETTRDVQGNPRFVVQEMTNNIYCIIRAISNDTGVVGEKEVRQY